MTDDYEKISDENLSDMQFVVYPSISSVAESQNLKLAMDEIKIEREKAPISIPNQYVFEEGEVNFEIGPSLDKEDEPIQYRKK